MFKRNIPWVRPDRDLIELVRIGDTLLRPHTGVVDLTMALRTLIAEETRDFARLSAPNIFLAENNFDAPITAPRYFVVSDRRAKRNLSRLDPLVATAIVDDLIAYEYDIGGMRTTGFLAQDAPQFSQFINRDGTLRLDYVGLYVHLWVTVQGLIKKKGRRRMTMKILPWCILSTLVVLILWWHFVVYPHDGRPIRNCAWVCGYDNFVEEGKKEKDDSNDGNGGSLTIL